MRRAAAVALVCLAIAAALAPLPRSAVERWYSSRLFPAIQRVVTPVSNLVPIALFDLLLVAAVVWVALCAYRRFRREGWRRGALALAGPLLVCLAAVYLAFLLLWGLNYRRTPLTEKLDYDAARVTADAARRLGDSNVATLNRLYAPAHASALSIDALAATFHDVQSRLGPAPPIVPGRPKQTILGAYFHQASVSGMTDPFFLETLVAPDLLDVERPFVIAHEWAHLAGYADESEANYVAWLVCRHGDAKAQYSGGLSMLGYAAPSRPLRETLDPGPRSDLFAIQRRYADTSRVLRAAAREGYDKYLKANRVAKGVESYDTVVQLILGTATDDSGYPRRR